MAILCFHVVQSQDIPSVYRTKYYYQLKSESASENIGDQHEVKEFLLQNNCVFIDSHSWEPERQNGYDTIANVTRTVASGSFYALRTEVSNAEYRMFWEVRNKNAAFYPDTMVWPSDALEDNPYQHYYFQHHAYNAYPVVGVSYEQALAFCRWKEEFLQKELGRKGIKGYTIRVSIPTESEWLNLYYNRIHEWLGSHRDEALNISATPTYLNFVQGTRGYRCNFGAVQTYRIQNIRIPLANESSYKTNPMECQSLPDMGSCYNILGNVSEWTSTPAAGSLFNDIEYLYTMSNRVIPNTQTRIDSAQLRSRLHKPEDLAQHFVVKGGSWKDEIYYLQPAALRILSKSATKNDIGFRYIVKVVKENP